jgi:hypothetical protein
MLQRQIAGHEERDIQPRSAGSGGGFQPDPAGADDHHPVRLGELDLEPVTLLDVAQVVHAVEIGAWYVKSARFGTRG